MTGDSIETIEHDFAGKGYGDFKKAVGEAVVEELTPVRNRYNELLSDKAYLEQCWKNGAETASRIAQRTLTKAMKKIGFVLG